MWIWDSFSSSLKYFWILVRIALNFYVRKNWDFFLIKPTHLKAEVTSLHSLLYPTVRVLLKGLFMKLQNFSYKKVLQISVVVNHTCTCMNVHTYFYYASLNSIQNVKKVLKSTSTHLSPSFGSYLMTSLFHNSPLSPPPAPKYHEMPGTVFCCLEWCVCVCVCVDSCAIKNLYLYF